MARPSDYTPELAAKICEGIAQGKSLRTVAREEWAPALSSVFLWLRDHKEFSDQYARACEERTEAHNEILLDLGDEALKEAHGADPKAANAVVSAVKLKADNLKWVMSKQKPKKYGDKVDVTSDGKQLPTPLLHVLRDNNSNPESSKPEETH